MVALLIPRSPKSVDSPIVVVRVLQSFYLLSDAAIKKRVIKVGGLKEVAVISRYDLIINPMERIRRIVVKDCPILCPHNKLLPILKRQLVGFVNVQEVALAPSYLLRLVKADELNKVAIQIILVT
jgi:hypothetical protein